MNIPVIQQHFRDFGTVTVNWKGTVIRIWCDDKHYYYQYSWAQPRVMRIAACETVALPGLFTGLVSDAVKSDLCELHNWLFNGIKPK